MAKQFSDAFYHSKAWRVIRAFVLRRDSYTCTSCGARANEVHHIIELTPDNINDDNIAVNPDNLTSLCHECHTKITKGNDGDVRAGYIFDEDGQVVEM